MKYTVEYFNHLAPIPFIYIYQFILLSLRGQVKTKYLQNEDSHTQIQNKAHMNINLCDFHIFLPLTFSPDTQ